MYLKTQKSIIVPLALSFSFCAASPQHKETSAEERDTSAQSQRINELREHVLSHSARPVVLC